MSKSPMWSNVALLFSIIALAISLVNLLYVLTKPQRLPCSSEIDSQCEIYSNYYYDNACWIESR